MSFELHVADRKLWPSLIMWYTETASCAATLLSSSLGSENLFKIMKFHRNKTYNKWKHTFEIFSHWMRLSNSFLSQFMWVSVSMLFDISFTFSWNFELFVTMLAIRSEWITIDRIYPRVSDFPLAIERGIPWSHRYFDACQIATVRQIGFDSDWSISIKRI